MTIAEATQMTELVCKILFCCLILAGIVGAVYAAMIARLEYRERLPPPEEEPKRIMGFAAARCQAGKNDRHPTDSPQEAPGNKPGR